MLQMCCHWQELCRKTFESGLRIDNLLDIVKNVEDENEVLQVHLRFLVATMRHFVEFGLLYEAFPWRFFLLLTDDLQLTASTLQAMRSEWEFLLSLEESGDCHRKYPCSAIPHLQWFAYREILTAAEESSWVMTEELKERVQAYFPEPCSTLGADGIFRNQRLSETKNLKQEISVEQLMACSAKTLNQRYKDFSVPDKLDFNGISPSKFLKKSVFDASRASATDSGLQSFNAMARLSTVSPHHLTRKSLNLWSAVKASAGKCDNFWSAQLVRSGQAAVGKIDGSLVVGKPY